MVDEIKDDQSLTDALAIIAETSDPYEFERQTIKWLSTSLNASDRASILLVSGNRLAESMTPLPSSFAGLERKWLILVIDEIRKYGAQILQGKLKATAASVAAQAIHNVDGDLVKIRISMEQSTGLLDFIRAEPQAATALRSLGAIIVGLKGTGVLSLVGDAKVTEVSRIYGQFLESSESPMQGGVGSWLRISREELLAWSDRSTSSTELPQIIGNLIRETTPALSRVHFPTGNGVFTGDWDGEVEAERSTTYVPIGKSGWELSVEEPSHGKAKSDFQNRVASVPHDIRSNMIYIQVNCRPWTKAREFESEMRAQGAFKEVRGYNVDDLVAWLELAPGTSILLREMMGQSVEGIRSVQDVYRTWLASTTTPLDAKILLAGRRDSVDLIRTRVQAGPIVTTVGGDVRRNEMRAFLAAMWTEMNEDTSISIPELIFIDNHTTFLRMANMSGNTVLIIDSDDLAREMPPRSNHHTIVLAPGSDIADVTIQPLDASELTIQFEGLGFNTWEATSLGILGRRSLLALRRHFAINQDVLRPEWAVPPIDVIVRRTLLLGEWNQTKSADVNLVERMVERTHQELEEALGAISHGMDGPFISVFDSLWHVIAPKDSWLLLARSISPSDVEAFETCAMEVLCERDPLVAVSPEDRWRAGIDGISSQFSDQLRRGLTTSLAIMGSMESNSHAIANTTGPEVASRIVSRILRVANEDNTGHLWSSLASSLSRLAEASPRDFLSALESALDQEPPLLLKMFGDTVTDRFGSSYSAHPNLLWALETLAWSPDYFANTAMILSRLAEIDPGGKLGNRPIASLISILYPAFPQTTATREARRNVATRIRTSYPEVSWKLMLSLLPNGVGGITLHSGPEFQTWKINEPIVTQREYVEVIRDIADDLLADVHIQVGRWVELLQSIQHLPPDKIDLVVEHFRRDLGALETFPERDRVWDEMRKFVAHQTTFRDASWAISDANFSLFAELLDQYQPIMDRNRWLFENHPQVAFDSSIRGDFEAKEKEIESLRMTAILNLARSQGYPAVKEFAEQVEAPGQVGAALARATHEEFDEQVLTLLIQNPDEQRDLTFGFCSVRFEQSGWDWLDRQLLRSGLPTTGLSLLLRSAREPIEAADRAGALGPEVESQYWRDFGIYGLGADFVEIRRVVEGLTNVRRTASALRFLAIYGIRGRSGSEMALQIAHAFETYIEDEESEREAFFLDEFELRSLLLIMLQHIDAVGMERAAAIEWYFLPALGVLDGTPILGYVLSRSPEWFVQMVCLVYKPEESVASDTSESSDEQRRMAQAAYQLLNSWNRCPGTDESGVLDGSALRHWVSKSRELLQESDRRRAGDDWIGVAMALAPIDPDGVWPHRAVRDLLEEIASQDVDRGFERKVSNSQGATSRSLFAGGGIERMRASEYQSLAASLRDEWPRLSAIFSRIAGTYERFAQREDTMAEKRRLGIDL